MGCPCVSDWHVRGGGRIIPWHACSGLRMLELQQAFRIRSVGGCLGGTAGSNRIHSWFLGVCVRAQQPSGLDVLVKEVLDRHFKFVEEHMLAMITNKQTGDFRLQLSRAVIWRRRP